MKTTSTTLLSLGAILLLALASRASANLVSNPGFESGISDWNFTFGNGGGGFTAEGTPNSGEGALLANTSFFASIPNSAFQDLSTVAGTSYDLSFFMSGGSGLAAGLFGETPTLQFQVFWGGVMIFDTTSPPASYNQFSFGNLLATGASTQLMFTFNTSPGFSFLLDDVSVEQATGSSVRIICPPSGWHSGWPA